MSSSSSAACATVGHVDDAGRDRSRQFVHRAIEVLLPRFPDEFLQLMRGCLPGQFVHIPGSPVGPRRVHTAAVAFDELQRFAYLYTWGCLMVMVHPDVDIFAIIYEGISLLLSKLSPANRALVRDNQSTVMVLRSVLSWSVASAAAVC